MFKHRLLLGIFICTLCACGSKREKTIGIITYHSYDHEILDSAVAALQRVYGMRVVHLCDTSLPKHTFIHVKSPRYRADKLIKHLKSTKPDSINHVLGLTDKDISTTKKDAQGNTKKPHSRYKDFGIFGLGYRPGASCVVSSFRLGRGGKRNKRIERVQKVCVHEVGHNLGLKHCPNKECVMTSAVEKLSTVDHAQLKLCAECAAEIWNK